MRKLKQPVITNSKGEVIRLTSKEQHHADYIQRIINERHSNSLGYEIPITTLSAIQKKITEQKFFEIPPADYLPVRVGEGTWSSNLVTYRSFDIAGEFETGIINLGGQNSRLASADTGVDALSIKVNNWAASIGWTIFELEEAARSGDWNIVSSKEKSRKKMYDLGVQRIAFLGARGQNGAGGTCLGLLNQSGITTNTTLITSPISLLSPADLKTFCAKVIEVYRNNSMRTCFPSHFLLPESDYNGLASQASADFPVKSTLELLEETFKLICRKPDFKILPLAYADAAYHADVASIAGKQVYVLLNYDEESLRLDIPLQYTNTLANSLDNFSFQNVSYSQFTGVLAYRPLELLYFTF